MSDTLEDNDLMPFGKHKGDKMIEVPAEYLLWLYNNNLKDGNVKNYIEDITIKALQQEVEENKKQLKK